MTDPWMTLVLLGVLTAAFPIEIIVTILLLRSPGGTATAGAWVAGKTVVRLVQFAVLSLVLDRAMDAAGSSAGPLEGVLLLVVAILLLVSTARKILHQPDDDAPPPGWMTRVSSATPRNAFLMGAGLVALSPKLWAITLGAIGAIAEAEMTPLAEWLTFIGWIVLAQGSHLVAILALVVAPARAEPLLDRVHEVLERGSRPLMIGVGLVFGVWFLLKALSAFGIGLGA